MTTPREVMSAAEAAAYVGVNPQTLRRMLARGEIAAAKFGREWRVHKDSLDEYLKPKLRLINRRVS